MAEAQAAALAAQRLAVRSGLQPDEIDPAEKPVAREVTTPSAAHLPWWSRQLAVIVARNFACEALLRRAGGEQSVAFIGIGETPDAARFSFLELSRAHASALRLYGGNGKDRTAARNDFTRGFLSGLQELLHEQAEHHALMVQPPPEVADYVANHRPSSPRSVRIQTALDEVAWAKGFTEGQRAGRRRGQLMESGEEDK